MKNTFKVLGLALLAGAMMFTACKKDEENNAPAATVSVNFNGQLQSINSYEAYTDDKTEWFEIIAANVVDSVTVNNLSSLDASTDNLYKGNDWEVWEMTFTSTPSKIVYDPEEGETYPEWMNAEDETITVSAFDATAMTVSTTASATMGSMYEFFTHDDLVYAPMTISANNMSMVNNNNIKKAQARKNIFK